MSPSASSTIAKLLTTPSKVAGALDWRKASGSLLSLTILRDTIELAVSSHPEFGEPLFKLPSIPLKQHVRNNRKTLDAAVVQELSQIVQDHQVCGFVVSWPVQKEGWCGAPCGRVLHTLDDLAANGKTLLSKTRPICLWDEEHHVPPEDEWGRAALYSTTTDETVHVASTEQYGDHQTAAAKVWNDFCKVHWPELYQHEYKQQQQRRSSRDIWEGKSSSSSSSRDNLMRLSAASSSRSVSWEYEIDQDRSLNKALL
jgi:RNase H-fold protein (predicted Holliday junction resolvase)